MFEIELKFKINGREVRCDQFVDTMKLQLTEVVRDAIQQQRLAEPTRQSLPQQNIPAEPHKPGLKPRVIPVHEAARVLGLKPATIRAWIGARKIASVHLGRRVMIPMETIDDLLERGFIPARKQG